MLRSYDVHGMCLNVEAESDELHRSVEGLLGPFAGPCACERPFSLVMRYGVPPAPDAQASADAGASGAEGAPPPGMRKFWEGVLPAGSYLRTYTSDSARELHVPGKARLHIDLPARRAVAVVRPGEERCLPDGCLVAMLCEFLAQTGHYVFHAACLAIGKDGARRAALMSGRSGTGKTTTALALAGQGMELVTDDASFLALPQGAAALALLPWLGDFERYDAAGDEFLVSCDSLKPADPLEEVRPALILLLEPRNPRAHLVRELDGVEVLARLVNENVRALDQRGSGAAGRAFGALAALVRSTPAWSLSVGPQLDGLREVIEPLMRSSDARGYNDAYHVGAHTRTMAPVPG
jgi:hypothetical protein